MRALARLTLLSALACDGEPAETATRCRACTIVVERALTIGGLEGPASFLGDPPVRQDSRGRIYVGNVGGFAVLVFDSAGTHVRTVGRQGEGPGEFEVMGSLAIDRFDTVYVFDRRLARATIISPDPEVVRTASALDASRAGPVTELPDGRFVITGLISRLGPAGYPLHVLGPDLQIERSFGADSGALPGLQFLEQSRTITAGTEGIWSSRRLEHAFELWSTDGRKLREIRHSAEWLPPAGPRRERRDGEPMPPPQPLIVAIDLDDAGYLWVLGSIADTGWKAPRTRLTEGGEYAVIEVQTPDEAFDTMIEVFDTTTGERVAALRHPLRFNQFARARTLAHRDELEDGRFLISMYRVSLASPP